MKKITLLIILTVNITMLFAQNVGINDDNSSPDASAMLDVKSSNKGILVPRVQLDDINTSAPVSNPATGLLIYANSASSVTEGFYYWDGTKWVGIASGSEDGDGDSDNELLISAELNGTTLQLSDAGGTKNIDLSSLQDGTGTDDQNLVLTGDVLTIENGSGSVDLSNYVDDADADPSNELQSLSLDGTEINISNGNSVDLAPIIPPGGTDDQNLILTGDVLSIENGSGAVDLSDYINDADASTTNELQTISKSGSTVTLSNGGGSFTDEVNDADAEPYNEIQTLSLTGSDLSISGGNSVSLPAGSVQDLSSSKSGNNVTINISDGGSGTTFDITDGDYNSSNEIQTLTLSGSTITLSNGGGSISNNDADASPTNELQNLQSVLAQGNSAGTYDIDMNNGSITDLGGMSFETNGDVEMRGSNANLQMRERAAIAFYNGSDEFCGSIEGDEGGYDNISVYVKDQMVWYDYNSGDMAMYLTCDESGYSEFAVDGLKNFVEDHPLDPTKEIVYACLEGPEAATYIRGKAQLINGESTVKLPDYFSLITNDKGLTVQVTPAGNCNGLFVEDSNSNQIIVKELGGGNSNVEYFYFVQGIRVGYEDYKVVRDNRKYK